MYKRLKQDIIDNMKSKRFEVVKTLRYLDANIQNKSMKLNKAIDDSIVIDVCRSEIKKVNEEIENAIKYNREETVRQKMLEKEIINLYIPKMLSEDETRIEILKIIDEIRDVGVIMKTLKSKFGSAIDMSEASKMVKKLLVS